jgi:CDP-6-deoxy-D-xylo-4-hexulose-3-dehydrase
VPLRYKLAEATIDQADLDALADWVRGNPWLTQGPLVRELERRWADWLGQRHAVFVNSGSSANLLMYSALQLSGRLRNQRVVVPAIAWATTVAPAIQLGFEPLMCDADPATFGLDLGHLDRLLAEHDPAAVITVPTLGIPGDVDGLLRRRERHRFALMEDCCPALGSRYRGRMIGTFGDLSSMSFYFGHHLSTIEGGMVATDDDRLYELLLHLRSHGWAKDIDPAREAELAAEREVLPFNRVFTFYHPGFNVRSTDLNAFIGLRQMDKVDWVVERRVENHRQYERRFAASADFHVPSNPEAVTCSISFVALAGSSEHRERVGARLRAEGIETRPLGGGSMGRQPFWVDRFGAQRLPVADRLHETSFMLPNHPYLASQDVDRICDVVLAVRA